MYAVIETGSKQYKVQPGDIIQIEKIETDPKQAVEMDRVLMVSKDDQVRVGTPIVEGVKVMGEVVAQDRDKKIIVFKYKKRKSYARIKGHRQSFTLLKIKEFVGI